MRNRGDPCGKSVGRCEPHQRLDPARGIAKDRQVGRENGASVAPRRPGNKKPRRGVGSKEPSFARWVPPERFLLPRSRPRRDEACNTRPELSSHFIGVGSFALVHAHPAGLFLFTTSRAKCQVETFWASQATGSSGRCCNCHGVLREGVSFGDEGSGMAVAAAAEQELLGAPHRMVALSRSGSREPPISSSRCTPNSPSSAVSRTLKSRFELPPYPIWRTFPVRRSPYPGSRTAFSYGSFPHLAGE